MSQVRPKFYALLAVALIIFLLMGCESMPRHERAWLAVHAVDTLQTYNAASDPCFEEVDPMTRSLIGAQPSESDVLKWSVGTALVHLGVSHTLRRIDAPRWLQNGWQAVTIANSAHAVLNNHHAGIRPWGSNRAPQAQNDACRVGR